MRTYLYMKAILEGRFAAAHYLVSQLEPNPDLIVSAGNSMVAGEIEYDHRAPTSKPWGRRWRARWVPGRRLIDRENKWP